ncbi:MAG: ParA family protein [Sphaerochaeta sp.]|jgi:chromosome partitioning protein|uniref:ParA family protein n=1 Tax=Sphaerochaeta sp. TaxID=1972642 RepID=UPI003D10331B
MTTLAVYSIKGGVGKSTISVNLAVLSAMAGQRTLLLDLDPLGSSSYLLDVKPRKSHDATALVKGGKQLTKQIQATSFSSLDVLPSSTAYRYLSILFDAKKHSHHRLEKRMEELSATYDLIIIDASPTMSLVSENVLYASDMLLVPVVPTPFAVLAYDQLLGELERLEQKDTRVHMVVSMLDRRKKLQVVTARELLLRKEALQTVIPFASEIEKMGEIQEPVVTSNPKGKGALAFCGLYEELAPFLMERSPSGRAEKKELNR